MIPPTVVVAMVLTALAIAHDIRVIDGDAFEMDDEMIRLWGVDTLELDQTFEPNGRTFEGAGQLSRSILEALLQSSVENAEGFDVSV